jgi:pantetheine-phosphate adenylyltransferase
MFTLTQRIAFITNAISDEYKSKVLVTPIDGLIANYVYENNIDHIARGVRDTNDLSSELSMAEYNRDLGGIETIFLPTKPELAKVSSSAVKVIAKNYGFVGDYVTTKVKHALEVKNGVNLIGVVGRSGSGKTTLCNALVNIMNNDITKMPYNLLKKQTNGPWRRAAFIDMDKLGHDIHKLDEPFAVKVRDALVGAFGSCVLDHHGHIDRSVLRNIVFSDKDAFNILNSVMRKPMRHLFSRLHQRIRSSYERLIHPYVV